MNQEDPITEPDEQSASQTRIGDRLREARLEKGLELDQVSAETRIQVRHLEQLEDNAFSSLPSRTYAIGFTRSYARLVGLDEAEALDQVRAELAQGNPHRGDQPAKFEPGDPARVPGRGLAWFGVLAAVILLAGIYAFYSTYFRPGLGPAPLQDETVQVAQNDAPATASAEPATPSGPVVFTSEMDGTWVKFYDASGERLYEAQMNEGDTFTIPADAEGPQVWTGRPYALAITVGGQSVPKLSEEDTVVRDVPVNAEALLNRSAAPAATTTPQTTAQ